MLQADNKHTELMLGPQLAAAAAAAVSSAEPQWHYDDMAQQYAPHHSVTALFDTKPLKVAMLEAQLQ